MKIAKRPLTDQELDELDELLFRIGGSDAMNVEELDGFQCALITCPEMVRIAEYMPKILGVIPEDAALLPTEKTLNRLLELMMQNWNCIVAELQSEGFHTPLLIRDEKGMAKGTDWANGFLTGTDLRRHAWGKLFEDENEFAPMIPIFALAYENHPDKTLRPYKKKIGKKLRSKLIAGAAAAVKVLYERRLQALHGNPQVETAAKTRRQRRAKVGRNDPCYCGSGKKYKNCCGMLKVN